MPILCRCPGTCAAQNLPRLKTRRSGLANESSAAATDLCGRGSQASTEEVDRRGVVMASAWPNPDFVANTTRAVMAQAERGPGLAGALQHQADELARIAPKCGGDGIQITYQPVPIVSWHFVRTDDRPVHAV